MNNKHSVRGIFCDLEKAFDCADHDVLLSKLKFYGIRGSNYALYESYLVKRHIRTVIYNDTSGIASDWLKIRQGTQQGSVSAPLLFHLHIKMLLKLLNSSSLLMTLVSYFPILT
jgi:hypothetical protein